MSEATPPVMAFNAGEVTPLVDGRYDLEFLGQSCQRQENIHGVSQGPAVKRCGTKFVVAQKYDDKKANLVDFEFEATQAYQLEIGEYYMRVCKDRAQVVVRDTDAAITNGLFASNISGWTDRSIGSGAIAHDATNERMSITGHSTGAGWAEQAVAVTDTAQEVTLQFDVFGVAGDTVELRVGTTSTGFDVIEDLALGVGHHAIAFTPGADPFYVQFIVAAEKTLGIDNVAFLDDVPFEITAPYTEAAARALSWQQSIDRLYLYHSEYHTRQVSRRGHASWSIEEFDFQDGPYLPENTESTTLQPGATSGYGVSLAASSTKFINGGRGFLSTDVGRAVRLKHSATWGWAIIVGVTNTTTATIDIRTAFGGTTAVSEWRLGLYSDTTGWPRDGTFYDQRFCLMGAALEAPGRWDGSKTGAFNTFAPGAEDDDPISINVAADKNTTLLWCKSARVLLFGSPSGELKASADSPSSPITPSNVQTRFETRYGCADIQPVTVAGAVLFVQRQGRKLREMKYDFSSDAYAARDLTVRADHILKSGIVQMAYQQEPYSIVWACRQDGALVGLTYQSDESVLGWHRHPLGGNFNGGLAVVESVSVIPGANGYDELWLSVKRTINGATKRYIEILSDPFTHETDEDDQYFVDCGLMLDTQVAITGATAASPVVISSAGHPFSDGDRIRITNIDGMTELNKNIYTVSAATGAGYSLTDSAGDPIDGTDFAAYISGGIARKMVTTIAGLDHLEGETAAVFGDGAYQGQYTITGGEIELTIAISYGAIGLPYSWYLQPQRPEGGSRRGTAQGKRARVNEATIRLYRTGGLQVGRNEASLKTLAFRSAGMAMDKAPPLFTGDKEVQIDGDWTSDTDFLLAGHTPVAATIVNIVPRIVVSE